ncbi:class I poly(R)-hydroxyalkanoic acid synthase [Vibrio sp. Of7-15]|uniref:class I poly(R)-hydroxyalkanoic acid synthase n=1 Tax=Vibrio sp. Of7-15 TaxID=2724879 RepID=UPI001EF36DFF|nr:class I poly(R)-hydroxyalkanoic acid synthase [Vibrio sp. Of7-15]MCG7496257.1 class I poly(R)-hydroxyalkanoic acid synthase [Vibrio sp. Of7-15]
MYQNFFSDYFTQLQECNQQWWKDVDTSKAVMNSPINKAFTDLNIEDLTQFFDKASNQPSSLMNIQMNWWENQLKIWQNVSVQGNNSDDVIAAERGDRRFKDPAWQEEAMYNFIKQSYLLFGKTTLDTINSVDGLDEKVKERLQFFSRQMINAMSPSNFVASNPELMKLTLESNGQNLAKGIELLQEDMASSADILKVRMTNNNAFRLGEEIANTPGDVVFRNDLFELIQYRPTTETVHKTPLLIVPPFINKYYILDLQEKNSMVRWLVEQGHTVFLMSWRNPGKSMANVDFEHYVTDGVVKAVDAIESITGEKQVNAAGYCIGGTLLATTVAFYSARRMRARIKTASFFTTLLDFSQPGEIGVYINDPIVSAMEAQNKELGYLDGRSLSVTFGLLRENSLYWNYYVDNYLKGNSPVDFDLLYWNSDSTNVAGKCHSTLLRKLYLENQLVQPKGIKVDGVDIDLSKIKIPTYFISTKEDHIALWQGTYRGAHKPTGKTTFVLGESGHIAGIVNHPDKKKYGYWVNPKLVKNPEDWLEGAKREDGSWWDNWNVWIADNSPQDRIPARTAGSKEYPIIEAAPGSYVRQVLPIEEDA